MRERASALAASWTTLQVLRTELEMLLADGRRLTSRASILYAASARGQHYRPSAVHATELGEIRAQLARVRTDVRALQSRIQALEQQIRREEQDLVRKSRGSGERVRRELD